MLDPIGQASTQCAVADWPAYQSALKDLRVTPAPASSSSSQVRSRESQTSVILAEGRRGGQGEGGRRARRGVLPRPAGSARGGPLLATPPTTLSPGRVRESPIPLDDPGFSLSRDAEGGDFRERDWPPRAECNGRSAASRTNLPHVFLSPANKGFM